MKGALIGYNHPELHVGCENFSLKSEQYGKGRDHYGAASDKCSASVIFPLNIWLGSRRNYWICLGDPRPAVFAQDFIGAQLHEYLHVFACEYGQPLTEKQVGIAELRLLSALAGEGNPLHDYEHFLINEFI